MHKTVLPFFWDVLQQQSWFHDDPDNLQRFFAVVQALTSQKSCPPPNYPPWSQKIEVWEKQSCQRYLSIPILETISETKQLTTKAKSWNICQTKRLYLFYNQRKSIKNICFFHHIFWGFGLDAFDAFLLVAKPLSDGFRSTLLFERQPNLTAIIPGGILHHFHGESAQSVRDQKSHRSIPW